MKLGIAQSKPMTIDFFEDMRVSTSRGGGSFDTLALFKPRPLYRLRSLPEGVHLDPLRTCKPVAEEPWKKTASITSAA